MTDGSESSKSYHHGDLRAALLAAGEAELVVSGVEGFSLRKVAKRAGVSHAAPAHHFKDTRGLLTALAARGFGRLLAMLEARDAENQSSARERLLAYGVAYIAFATEHTALFRLCFASDKPDHGDPALATAGAEAYGAMANLVAEIRGADLSETALDASAVWGLTHGLADLLASGKMDALQALDPPAREAAIKGLLARTLR